LLSIDRDYEDGVNLTRVRETKRQDATSQPVVEQTTMVYDRLNRLRRRTNYDNKELLYTFDRQGNRTSLRDPDGLVTRYVYDARNRVCVVATDGADPGTCTTASGTTVTKYAYWPDGLPLRTEYPNGSVSEWEYDAADRTRAIVNHNGDVKSPISRYAYTYDANGNRQTQTETRSSPGLGGGAPETTTYEYDTLNRLTSVTYGNGATVIYGLEPNGNRKSETGTDPATGAPVDRLLQYNKRNQLERIIDRASASSTIFGYDANGNTREERVGTLGEGGETVTPPSVKQFTFDIRDRLVAVNDAGGPVTFDYDYEGMRTRKAGPLASLKFLYDDRSLLQEYEPASLATLSKYDYGQRLISLSNSPQTGSGKLFYLFDSLGSTSELTDARGGVRAAYAYDAYGGLRDSVELTPNRIRFTGHYADTETNLYYARARYYDNRIGRFVSQDAVLGREQSPPSLHRYVYANVNPLLYVDPLGTSPFEAGSFGDWYWQVSLALGDQAERALTGTATYGKEVVEAVADMNLAGTDLVVKGVGAVANTVTGGRYTEQINQLTKAQSNIGKWVEREGFSEVASAGGEQVRETAQVIGDRTMQTVLLPDRLLEAVESGSRARVHNVLNDVPILGSVKQLVEESYKAAMSGDPRDFAAVVPGWLATGASALGAARTLSSFSRAPGFTGRSHAVIGAEAGVSLPQSQSINVVRSAIGGVEPRTPFTLRRARDLIRNDLRYADFRTEPGEAVFWTGFRQGNMDLAKMWAKATNTKTIDMTPGGAWLDRVTSPHGQGWLGRKGYREAWSTASGRFANEASGPVTAFIRGTQPTANDFYGLELPILRLRGVDVEFDPFVP
jgi:RHS repeat-associated protein